MPRAKNARASKSEPKTTTSAAGRAAAPKRRAKELPAPAEPETAAAVATTALNKPARPGGKLGLLVDHLATAAGATADELAAATGWQKHTVLGALSRLRSRGFTMQLETASDRKAYRLVAAEA